MRLKGVCYRMCIVLLAGSVSPLSALAEGGIPYDTFLKAALVKQKVVVNGEKCVRAYVKPENPDLDPKVVSIEIRRNGKTLKVMIPAVRERMDPPIFIEFPWEIYVPIGKKYAGATLVHNLPPGSLQLAMDIVTVKTTMPHETIVPDKEQNAEPPPASDRQKAPPEE